MTNVDWANALDWGLSGIQGGGGNSFRAPSEFNIARGVTSNEDFRNYVNKFGPVDQNAALLQALGYTGNPFQSTPIEFDQSSQGWSDDALNWLDSNGYNVGVGHMPGTSSGGRAEFWGLTGPDGKYVQGQADPTMTTSDTLMEQIGMFAMLAGPFAHATGLIGSGTGAALGAAGELGSTLPTIGDFGLNALSSVGTDAAASFFAELAGNALPAAGGVAGNVLPTVLSTGAAAGGSLLPSLLPALGAAGAAMSPGMSQLPQLDRVEMQGSAQQPQQQPAQNVGGLLGSASPTPTATLDRVELTGNSTPTNEPLVPPLVLPDIPYTNPLPMQGIDQILSQTPTDVGKPPTMDGNSVLPDWLKGVVDPIKNAVGGGQNLAGLIGAGLGAASGGGTNTATSQSKMDPRMEQYVYGSGFGDANSIMGGGYGLWQQNKSGINPTMQQGLDMQRAALQDPNYGGAFTQMRNLGQGLMGSPIAGNPFTNGSGGLLGPQQPTAQAGGTGGLINPQDRFKALMARGGGLIG